MQARLILAKDQSQMRNAALTLQLLLNVNEPMRALPGPTRTANPSNSTSEMPMVVSGLESGSPGGLALFRVALP